MDPCELRQTESLLLPALPTHSSAFTPSLAAQSVSQCHALSLFPFLLSEHIGLDGPWEPLKVLEFPVLPWFLCALRLTSDPCLLLWNGFLQGPESVASGKACKLEVQVTCSDPASLTAIRGP